MTVKFIKIFSDLSAKSRLIFCDPSKVFPTFYLLTIFLRKQLLNYYKSLIVENQTFVLIQSVYKLSNQKA